MALARKKTTPLPKLAHSDEELISILLPIGEAYARGVFSRLEGGLRPRNYVDDGFYHFGAEYDVIDEAEFDSTGL